jgi:hypothetical protein
MSFQNASLQILKNLYNRVKSDTRYTVIDAVMDARNQNNSIVESDLQFSAGKKRQLKMNYYPVVCDGEGSCTESVCDTGTALEPKQQIFEVSQCTASKVYRLNVDDIRMVDDNLSFSDHASAQIASVLGGVRKALASDIAAILVANVGCLPNGADTKQLALTDPVTGAIRPLGLWQIEQVFHDAGMASPFLVGGTDVFTWSKATGIGGLNNQGQETGRFNNAQMYYDPLVDAAFGDPTHGHVLAFDPQMLKFVTFSRNSGMFATNWKGLEDMDKQFKESKNGTIKGTFLDPVTGLMWDLDIRYQDCEDEHWTFRLRLEWDIFFLPDYICNLDCVNGIYHFTTCLPVTEECDNVTPPAPVSPTLYEWTPGSIFPLYVGKLEFAGATYMPNASGIDNVTELAALMNATIDGYVFTVAGSDITYSGYSEKEGQINDSITIDFEPATT